jgi:hypothetical protein
MKSKTGLLASALLLVPFAAASVTSAPFVTSAHAANCGAAISAVSNRLDAVSAKTASTPRVAPHRAESAWAITWNRMATASQNANAATSAPADIAPTGVEEASADELAWDNPGATTLQRAHDALAAAQAADTVGDRKMCRRFVADARQLLKSLS